MGGTGTEGLAAGEASWLTISSGCWSIFSTCYSVWRRTGLFWEQSWSIVHSSLVLMTLDPGMNEIVNQLFNGRICFWLAKCLDEEILWILWHFTNKCTWDEVAIKLFLRQPTLSETRTRSRLHLASWKTYKQMQTKWNEVKSPPHEVETNTINAIW